MAKRLGEIDISSPPSAPPSGRPRTAGSKGSQDRYPQRGMSTDDYGRPSLDSQRNMPRGYPPQGPPQGPPDQRRGPPRGPPQGPPRQDFDQRRGPPPGPGYGGGPRQNGYGDPGYDQGYGGDNFGPPQRSMTMPDNSNSMGMGNRGPLPPVSGPGPSAPYNGPIGRSVPVRPATATGSRPPPQRAYQNQPPAQHPQQQYPPENAYSAGGYDNHGANESIGDFYDSYYESPPPVHNRTLSSTSEMPDFDNAAPPRPLHRRGTSIEAHIQLGAGTGPGQTNRQSYERDGNLRQLKPAKSQPDFRAQAQPQTAIFEMAGDAPPIPDMPQQAYQDGWGQQNAQYDAPQQQRPPQGQGNSQYDAPQQQQQRPPQGQGYGSYDGQEQPFVPPPRSASAAPGAGRGFGNGPRPGFGGGLPSGPSPQNGGFQLPQNGGFQAPQNGGFQAPQNGGFQAPQNGSYQNQQNGGFQNQQNGGFQNQPNGGFQGGRPNNIPKQATPEGGLPPHAPPIRPGLMPNSFAAQQQNIKPPPVRNYAGVSPGSQQSIPTQPMNSASPGVPSPSPVASPAAAPQPVTQEEIDRLRLKYKNGNPNDKETPLLFVKKLVEASEVLVGKLADQRARNKAREKYVFEATKVLKKLREQQHPEAMFYFADCYGRGALGLEVNEKEAFTLYQSAAKLGHPGAAYRTAVCCELGNDEGGGTRKDPMKAIQWYTRAATLGDTPAMYKMGMIKLKGLLGQQANPREAVVWLKRAAERADPENPHALHELGLLYEAPQTSDGALLHDEGYALQLFTQAAELGYKFSQFRLGQAYEYGLFGLPIDARQSIMWYSKAAVQDEHQSELALSGWYLTGHEGILQQSDTEAYLWARKAAMAKLAKAEYAMGYYCEEGIGTPKSLEDAKRWYWRAAGMLGLFFCYFLFIISRFFFCYFEYIVFLCWFN
jgi:TPR repeat protein